MAERQRLVCIGNLTIDEAVTATGASTVSAGGDALFAALAARLRGADARILAPLGADAPRELLEAVSVAGTDPAELPRRSAPTVRNIVRYDEAGGRTWTLLHGEAHFENLSVRPGDVSSAALDADGVLISAMALRAQLALAPWLRERYAGDVFFDPQEDYLAGNEQALLDAVRLCDVFLPSEIEALALARTDDPRVAAARLLELGPRIVVVKQAAAGCLVAWREHPAPVRVPANDVLAVDSTGAGDAFCGGFAAAMLAGAGPIEAAESGAVAAGVAVQAPGVDALVRALRQAGVAA